MRCWLTRRQRYATTKINRLGLPAFLSLQFYTLLRDFSSDFIRELGKAREDLCDPILFCPYIYCNYSGSSVTRTLVDKTLEFYRNIDHYRGLEKNRIILSHIFEKRCSTLEFEVTFIKRQV